MYNGHMRYLYFACFLCVMAKATHGKKGNPGQKKMYLLRKTVEKYVTLPDQDRLGFNNCLYQ